MAQIEINCIGQTAIYTNTPEIFSGDVNIDKVKFTFDEAWNGYDMKTAVFYNNPKDTYPVMLDENNVAVIPEAVMADKCKLGIGVFGTNANGDVKTSKILTYNIGKGAISNDLEATTPPEFWEQLLTRQIKFENNIDGRVSTLETDVDTVEAIALGRNQALAYTSYSEMVTALNGMGSDELNRGQNIYIGALGVPDLWVYGVEAETVEYTFVDDDTFVEGLNVNTTVQVGYYKLAQLETQKVDVGGITNDINTLKDDVEPLKSDVPQIKDTLGYTVGKNLLENTGTSTTLYGVTITVNDDGSVTLNGTATGNHVNFSIKENFYLPNGEYILSGCPKGGSTNTYYFCLYDGETLCNDIGEGGTFVANSNIIKYVRIVIVSGQTVENLTFYPMIRKADVTDDTYEPCSGIDIDTRFNDLQSILPSIVEWKTATGSGGTLINLDGVYGDIEISVQAKYGANSMYAYLSTKFKNVHLSNTPTTKTLSGTVNGDSTTCTITYQISKTMFQITKLKFGNSEMELSYVTSITIYYR